MKKLIFILALICNLTFAIYDCSSQWYQVNLPAASTIQKVQFVNPNTGWLIMYNNNLLKSTNGGINWSVIIDTTNHLFEFQFINDTLGYGLGVSGVNNLLLRTTNGGYNWTVMQSSSLFMLSGFYFANADTGYFNGDLPPIFRTLRRV